MEKIRVSNVIENIKLLEMFNEVSQALVDGQVQVVSNTHLKDLFQMAEGGHQDAKDLCGKLGIDKHALNDLHKDGTSEIKLEADPKKVYEELMINGKQAEKKNDKKTLHLLDDLNQQIKQLQDPGLAARPVQVSEYETDLELEFECQEEDGDQSQENSEEDNEEEEIEIEFESEEEREECLKSIDVGRASYHHLKPV